MIYRKIDTSKVKPELDFDQIQSDLAKFRNQHKGDDNSDQKHKQNGILLRK